MLGELDLDKKLKRKEWQQRRAVLQERCRALLAAAAEAGIPLMIVFEGWDAADIGSSITLLSECADPARCKIWRVRAALPAERNYPWMWRFWCKLPGRGEVALFDRSWYRRVLAERLEELVPEPELPRAYRDIVEFEQMLAADGYLLLKYWLHISRAERKRRLSALAERPAGRNLPFEEDVLSYGYSAYLQAAEEMLQHTAHEQAPWHLVEADNRPYAWWRVLSTAAEVLAQRLPQAKGAYS
jgi:polyphosphate kinase 2 (PPK2 family)